MVAGASSISLKERSLFHIHTYNYLNLIIKIIYIKKRIHKFFNVNDEFILIYN